MRITVIGAGGRLGTAVTIAALERGHEVIAAVRAPEAYRAPAPGIEVAVGDAAFAGDVMCVTTDADAVVVAIGSADREAIVDGAALSGVHRVAIAAALAPGTPSGTGLLHRAAADLLDTIEAMP